VSSTTIDVTTIRPIDHEEAMALAAVEYERFLDLVRGLRDEDWAKPTDCDLWDVRAMVGHNLGNVDAAASVIESVRQQAKAFRRARRDRTPMVDGMTAVQVEERAGLTTTELLDRLARSVPKAVAGRRRTPKLIRERARFDMGEGRKRPLGDLLDLVYTRDVFMHRVDLWRATGRPLVLEPDHEGRIVADVVREWADNHGRPFDLTLTGPAGGHFVRGEGGEVLELDAVEFCRILAGRADGGGLLATAVLF
jgi:uncharacterized protein (TIGR03083 family)